jgi:hypothetical protein
MEVFDPRIRNRWHNQKQFELDSDVQLALNSLAKYLDDNYAPDATPTSIPTQPSIYNSSGPYLSDQSREMLELVRGSPSTGTVSRSGSLELGEYLAESNLPNLATDPLKEWKSLSSRWPTLARMARDVLSIPGKCEVDFLISN